MSIEFSKAIKSDEIFFKYAKGKRDIFGKEFHNYHEIFLFMNGDAEFISEGQRIKLEPNTLVIIPKEKYHQFNVLGLESNYIRCVFNFQDIKSFSRLIEEKLKNVYLLKLSNEINYFFEKQIKILENNMDESIKIELTKATLLFILNEIETKINLKNTNNNFHEITNQCIRYISENITNKITTEEIANKLNISPSYMTHVFKKDMNIPIYKYILEKKLIIANQMINSGKKPTIAAIECGFNDYSGFYRQFVKMFGVPPSKL